MKFAEIQELAKQKSKANRMNIDKLKKTARQRNQEIQDNKKNENRLEIYCYDSESCGRL